MVCRRAVFSSSWKSTHTLPHYIADTTLGSAARAVPRVSVDGRIGEPARFVGSAMDLVFGNVCKHGYPQSRGV